MCRRPCTQGTESENGQVREEIAASFARPGGMITGLSNISADITEKYLELLLDAAPKLKRVGFLGDANNPTRASLKKGCAAFGSAAFG